MDRTTFIAFTDTIEKSLQTSIGQKWINGTHQRLLEAYKKKAFNSERALEMYTIAIERSVLSFIKGRVGYTTMKTLRENKITTQMASELVEQFKAATEAHDQRPTRKGLGAKIVGK